MAYTLKVDFTGAGTFGGAHDDVSADCVGKHTWARGRASPHPFFGRSAAGTATFFLNNTSGLYAKNNASGALFGNLLTGRRVQLTINGTDRWAGQVMDFVDDKIGMRPVVRLECEGAFSVIKDIDTTPPANSGALTGTQIANVLDDIGWPSGRRALDSGQTITSRWYVAKQQAFSAIRDLEDSEGLGLFYEDAHGNLCFEDRATRQIGTHLVSQATYSDASGASLPIWKIERVSSQQYVINDATCTVTPSLLNALTTLWTLQNEIPVLTPGSSVSYFATIDNSQAFNNIAYVDAWTTPVVGTDIIQSGVANSDIAITVSKFATEMKITIQNNNVSSAATLSLVSARGTAVTKLDATTMETLDATSQGVYGPRSNRNSAPWFPNTAAAQDYCNNTVRLYKDERDLFNVYFVANLTSALATSLIARLMSDRITLTATQQRTGLYFNGDVYVEQFSESWDFDAGGRYEFMMGVSAAPPASAAPWVLGTSVLNTSTILAF